MTRSLNRSCKVFRCACDARLAAIGLGITLLALTLCASPALSAPVHPVLPGLTMNGFDKACGTAVDSKGDIYVSSAGESKVEVFDSEHKPLTSIADANEPCGLAVDSKGLLYVSEQKTENVVRFTPTEYPFSGTPTYGVAVTIDSSGKAKGIAVDPYDNHLYAAKGSVIDIYGTGGEQLGHIGEGSLTNATAVSVYTHEPEKFLARVDRYVFAADSATNKIDVFSGVLNVEKKETLVPFTGTMDGSDTPTGAFGFGAVGAALTVDRGNESTGKCVAVAEQACTAGHVFVYDQLHGVVDEFEATGSYVTQMKLTEADAGFLDAQPSAITVGRSGDAHDGTVYVSGGSGLGAELLAYGPLAAPSRAILSAPVSRVLEKASAVAVDAAGDVYVADNAKIHIFSSDGNAIGEFEDSEAPYDLSVDSTGKLYVLAHGPGGVFAEKENVTYYTPSSYPPTAGVSYVRHTPSLVTLGSFPPEVGKLTALTVDPANDHVFVAAQGHVSELDSAAHGSGVLNADFGAGLSLDKMDSIGVYGSDGDVYVGSNGVIWVIDPTGTRILAQIMGTGTPVGGTFIKQNGANPAVAVDQANGHVVAFDHGDGAVEEFDAAGTFVAEFGAFTKNVVGPTDRIAIDNSGGSGSGRVYAAFDDPKPETFDVTAFGPLAYGESPSVVTGAASGLGGGEATLNGTVDPRGFDLESCRFEYVTETAFQAKEFAGAASVECEPAPVEIGKGTGRVAVHAVVTGLEADGRYRFRLVAENKYGATTGSAGLFGAPVVTGVLASPVRYTEAVLHATVDPSGVASKYRFEYGPTEEYGHVTTEGVVAADAGATQVQASLTGLDEGVTYHFRVVAVNGAGAAEAEDKTFLTLARRHAETCGNTAYRSGFSAGLPDCRAYELVTPAETGGLLPYAASTGEPARGFNDWLVSQHGPDAGESVAYFTDGSLPGFEGDGKRDGYHATRMHGEGAHPPRGWVNTLFGPSFRASAAAAEQHGVAADQAFSFWDIFPLEQVGGTLPSGSYLRTSSGFEPVGEGSLGTDLEAVERYVSAGGTHVIFMSTMQLEAAAPGAGTRTIYDRHAGVHEAQVVSVKPDGSPFAEGENATYIDSNEDGSAGVFSVAGTLYVHREGVTFEIAEAPVTYAGISTDGKRVLYAANGSGTTPASLFACDLESSSGCAGVGAHAPVLIAPESVFVDVSPDASHAYFTSTLVLDQAEEGVSGANNLYAWDGTHILYVDGLVQKDFEHFEGEASEKLGRWTAMIGVASGRGLGDAPVRSTPDGSVLVFQSHARLTGYDNHGVSEIYRFDPSKPAGERVVCVSCDPTGAPPASDALFEDTRVVYQTSMIANVTDDGRHVFFQTKDRLLPEDVNSVEDVYEWTNNGTNSCSRMDGCLALISSGQGERDSEMYGMSADGHDVFFRTDDRLVASDVAGSPSIYDARVEGGIPNQAETAPCQGDACQGKPSQPPTLSIPASLPTGSGNVTPPAEKAPGGSSSKTLTQAQKLARALKACAKQRPKRKRKACEARARKRYGAKRATRSTHVSRRTNGRTGK